MNSGRLRRILLLQGLLFLLLVASVSAYVRLAEHDPAAWHVDPMTSPATGKENDFLVLPEGAATAGVDVIFERRDMTAGELMAAFDAVVRAAPRTELIAGSVGEGFATYLQRTAIMGFPDFISVRAVEDEDGAGLAIWSRSRFGHSDLGVNKARIEGWLAALDARLGQG